MSTAVSTKCCLYAQRIVLCLATIVSSAGAIADRALVPGGQHAAEVLELHKQRRELVRSGNLEEAAKIAELAVSVTSEHFGDEHPETARALFLHGQVQQRLGKSLNAEQFFLRALKIQSTNLGQAHSATAQTRNSLALLYRTENRYHEAETLLKYALEVYATAKNSDFRQHVYTLDILIGLYRHKLKLFKEALSHSKRVLAMRTRELGAENPETLDSRSNLALLYRDMGRYTQAEQLLKDTLATYEKSHSGEHVKILKSLDNLIGLYRLQDRLSEAEPHMLRAVALAKQKHPNRPELAARLTSLALLYRDQQRFGEAAPLMERALAIREVAPGKRSHELVETLNVISGLYRLLNRHREAELHLQRAVMLRKKELGPRDPKTADSMTNLALVYLDTERFRLAEQILEEAIGIREALLGRDHITIAYALDMLAAAHRGLGRMSEAEDVLKRALSIRRSTMGLKHPDTARTLRNLAGLHVKNKNWAQAVEYFEKSNDIFLQRRETKLYSSAPFAQRQVSSEIKRHSSSFFRYVHAAHRLGATEADQKSELIAKTFVAAQWTRLTSAARSLAQMSARFSSGETTLAKLIREQHDGTVKWKKLDTELVRRLLQPEIKRNRVEERRLRDELDKIESRFAAISKELDPSYIELSQPRAISIAETQDALKPHEVLVLFIFGAQEGYLWTVTKRNALWRRLSLGTYRLERDVNTLRCGLDSSNWVDVGSLPDASEDDKRRRQAQIARRERCRNLTGKTVSASDAPPFDTKRAHHLYKALFGEVEDLINDKNLIVVPSGPLAKLPFQVLAKTEPESSVDYAPVDWLIRNHAITVLPSVSSLKALRRDVKESRANRPFLGFGNPLLVGHTGENKSAWAKQSCPKTVSPTDPVNVAGLARPENISRMFRGGKVDVAALRRQEPLPETADELCAVAQELDAGGQGVYLGSEATETKLGELNQTGDLAKARVLHFATHGLIASETKSLAGSLAEPSLILTPPDRVTDIDDGLLTASDVAALKLDADWVVLSACNTAAGGAKDNAEALSGLARSFFYAGARALLVSHWYVDSHAAVQITTRAFAELKRDKKIGRAEALRRSMLAAMQDATRPRTWTPAAHPATWGPFVIVGEGGSAHATGPRP